MKYKESPKIVCGVEEEYRESTGRKIKVLRSDNRGEYKNDLFLRLCRNESIVRHFTVRETLQQNGVAESVTVPVIIDPKLT